jgi:hypothetical protein
MIAEKVMLVTKQGNMISHYTPILQYIYIYTYIYMQFLNKMANFLDLSLCPLSVCIPLMVSSEESKTRLSVLASAYYLTHTIRKN